EDANIDEAGISTLADDALQKIAASLLRHGGNRSKVAKELGLSDRTVYRKVKLLKEKGIWQDK
ncbi:MAG: helix-turn-helix domain-containing protein, partial [Bacteroidales bacterium]|nr:helix-turn-helix domain-containing protein [Bacteroidales bacterium]